MNKIPLQGLFGHALLREAITEYRAVIDVVRTAIAKRLYPTDREPWVSLEAIFPDHAVVNHDGKTFCFDYTLDDAGNVNLAEPVQVQAEFVPIHEALHVDQGNFIEAEGEASSGKWLIRVIQAGLSGNRNFYPDATLREAVPMFNAVRVFVKSDAEHVDGQGKAFLQLVGGLSDAVFVEGASPDTGEIRAVLTMIEPEGAIAVKVREAYQRGLAHLFGFSIDANATAATAMREGKKIRTAKKITKVNSVDLIVEPGAGGQLIRMVEAIEPQFNKEQDMNLRQRMLEAIRQKTPTAFAGVAIEDISDEALEQSYRESLVSAKPAAASQDVAELIRMVEARGNARNTINSADLPAPAKQRLLADFAARESFADADVASAIKAEQDYLAQFTESGHVRAGEFGSGARAEDRSVKVADMLDAFFDPAHKDHRSVRSFKEAYVEITGDKDVTGRIENCDRSRLREAVGGAFRESLDSASFANVLGNSLTRRMVSEYNTAVEFQAWRRIASVVPINDFRTQERVRYGGYGDLAIVDEKDPYVSISSPTDEKATYGVKKRGNTEDITMEMIKNDDVGAIRGIPQKLGRAAQRTLAKFVFDFLRTNPTIYDGLALFHASHGNLATAALDATSLAARRLAMLKQTEKDSGDRLGIGPRTLVVPVDLQQAAVDLFKLSTNNEKTFIQALTLDIIPVWYWTDATDWCLVADPRDIPTIEVGFLDGAEEPSLFVQDMPNSGSMFANDTITYKIRHIYGGAVVDYRGLDKSVVAG